MTEGRPPRTELLATAGDGYFLRNVAEAVLQLLLEGGAEGPIDAGRHARSVDRPHNRKGHRDRTLDTIKRW